MHQPCLFKMYKKAFCSKYQIKTRKKNANKLARLVHWSLCAIELFTFNQPNIENQSESKYNDKKSCTILFYFRKPGATFVKRPITN